MYQHQGLQALPQAAGAHLLSSGRCRAASGVAVEGGLNFCAVCMKGQQSTHICPLRSEKPMCLWASVDLPVL